MNGLEYENLLSGNALNKITSAQDVIVLRWMITLQIRLFTYVSVWAKLDSLESPRYEYEIVPIGTKSSSAIVYSTVASIVIASVVYESESDSSTYSIGSWTSVSLSLWVFSTFSISADSSSSCTTAWSWADTSSGGYRKTVSASVFGETNSSLFTVVAGSTDVISVCS